MNYLSLKHIGHEKQQQYQRESQNHCDARQGQENRSMFTGTGKIAAGIIALTAAAAALITLI